MLLARAVSFNPSVDTRCEVSGYTNRTVIGDAD